MENFVDKLKEAIESGKISEEKLLKEFQVSLDKIKPFMLLTSSDEEIRNLGLGLSSTKSFVGEFTQSELIACERSCYLNVRDFAKGEILRRAIKA